MGRDSSIAVLFSEGADTYVAYTADDNNVKDIEIVQMIQQTRKCQEGKG